MLTPDQFTKNALRDALCGVNSVETEVEVIHATQRIDLYAFPLFMHAERRMKLGLVGDFAADPGLYEAFWSTPGVGRIRRCIAKQLAWHHELERRAHAASQPSVKPEKQVFPWLNVLSTGRPDSVLIAYACSEVRPGVYVSVQGLRLRIVVICELPRVRETLLFRMFGRGQVFQDAMCDLDELPDEAWEKKVITPLLNDFGVDGRGKAETNQEADVTRVQQLHALAEVCRRGIAREGQREVLRRQLRVLFGDVPEAVEARIRAGKQGEIDQWTETILRAKTIDQVFDGVPLAGATAQTRSRPRSRQRLKEPCSTG